MRHPTIHGCTTKSLYTSAEIFHKMLFALEVSACPFSKTLRAQYIMWTASATNPSLTTVHFMTWVNWNWRTCVNRMDSEGFIKVGDRSHWRFSMSGSLDSRFLFVCGFYKPSRKYRFGMQLLSSILRGTTWLMYIIFSISWWTQMYDIYIK